MKVSTNGSSVLVFDLVSNCRLVVSARRAAIALLAALSFGADLAELPAVHSQNFLTAIRQQLEQARTDAATHPRDAQATGMFAMTLHAYQQYEPAAAAYARAHFLEPDNFDWVYLLGAVQAAQGDFPAAVTSFRNALRLRPDYAPAQVRLAQALALAGAAPEAAALYRRILTEHPDSPLAWYGLGRLQEAAGDHAGAAQSFAKACEAFPAYGVAQFALARELRRAGKQQEAAQHIAMYEQNVTAEPPLDDPLFGRIRQLNRSAQVHLQRGAELEKAGRFAEAIAEEEQALAADPANVQAHVNLVALCGRTGDRVKAREHFQAAIKLDAGRADAWYNFGVLALGDGKVSEAEDAFRNAIARNPQYAEAHANLGAIFEREGRVDDAAGEFREAMAAQPVYPFARFHLGRILANQKKYEEAVQQFMRALEPEDEKTPTYLYALGATYARAGNRASAIEYLERARAGASARGQADLVSSISRDLNSLRGQQ